MLNTVLRQIFFLLQITLARRGRWLLNVGDGCTYMYVYVYVYVYVCIHVYVCECISAIRSGPSRNDSEELIAAVNKEKVLELERPAYLIG